MVVVRELAPDEYPLWDRLVCQSPEGTVYHTSIWLKAITEAVGGVFRILGGFDGGALQGGIPFQVKRRGPFTVARRAYATPYAGTVLHPDCACRRELEQRLLARARRCFSQISVTFSPFHPGADKLAEAPGVRLRATYVNAIGNPQMFWDGVASEVRNRIRKAEKGGIAVVCNESDRAFYALYRDTFARKGKEIPIGEGAFARLLHHLRAAGLGTSYVAVDTEGVPSAACLILADSKRIYYSLAASHAELRKMGAPSLLMWRAVQDFCSLVPEFDMGGANVASVAQFKSKFCGVKTAYPEFRHYRSHIERLCVAGYTRLREMRS